MLCRAAVMQAIERAVRAFVTKTFLFDDPRVLPDDASFLELGVIDSTGVLELVGFLEREYGIVVEDRELVPVNLDSIGGVTRFVAGKLRARGPRVAG